MIQTKLPTALPPSRTCLYSYSDVATADVIAACITAALAIVVATLPPVQLVVRAHLASNTTMGCAACFALLSPLLTLGLQQVGS